MKKLGSALLATALAGCAATAPVAVAPEAATGQASTALADGVRLTTPTPRPPEDLQVLFWSPAQRQTRFADMEGWFAGLEVAPPSQSASLPAGQPLSSELSQILTAAMEETNAVGVLVLDNGTVRYESYRGGFDANDRWTSFSVAKSLTSTLLGAALKDGSIASLNDPVSRYIPELANSVYADVTVRQLATMTSGAKWNEDYTDPNSDVARMQTFLNGTDNPTIAQMRTLDREAPAGEKWVYKTGETNLLGLLVERAVGMPLAAYAKGKIVDPAGFEAPLFWMVDPSGGNIGGCCLSLRLRDYARFAQYVLEDGRGQVPAGWFEEAGGRQVAFDPSNPNGFGYGYQWWTYPGQTFGAQGIFGQAITLVPEDNLAVVILSNWDTPTTREGRLLWLDLTGQILAEMQREDAQ